MQVSKGSIPHVSVNYLLVFPHQNMTNPLPFNGLLPQI